MATSGVKTKRSAPSMTGAGSSPAKVATRPQRLVAIDPGEVHCGVAAFLDDRCFEAFEVDPEELYRRLETWLSAGVVDVLVVESFQLYEDKALAQVGSEFGTCECIGVIKYLHSKLGGNHKGRGRVELAMQPAGIKEATSRVLRAKKVVSLAKSRGAGGHAFDAELHGYHYIMRQRQSRGEHV